MSEGPPPSESDEGDYVNPSFTLSPIEYTIKKDFISKKFTNIIDTGIDIDPDIVNLIFTKHGLIVAGFIQKHPIFVAPLIYHTQKQHRQVIDPYLVKFRKYGILVRNEKLTIEPPLMKPRLQGRRPPVWHLSHFEVKDAMDPRLQPIRLLYWDLPIWDRYRGKGHIDIMSRKDLQNKLCKKYIDIFIKKNRVGKDQHPKTNEVRAYLNEDKEATEFEPLILQRMAYDISSNLYQMEVSARAYI